MAKKQHPSRLERILVPALLVAAIGVNISSHYRLADHQVQVIGRLTELKVEMARMDTGRKRSVEGLWTWG